MIIDSAAIVAFVIQEPEAAAFIDEIVGTDRTGDQTAETES